MPAPLAIAVAVSAAVVLSTPYVGQARDALQNAFPDYYRTIVASTIGAAAAAGIVFALGRIRSRRLLRYGALLTALALAAGYAIGMRTGESDRDLVERFHFVEYGVIAFLFCTAWRTRRDLSAVVLPLCAGIVVGIADEWFQWFVPNRVGEGSDVMINTVAVTSGVLFSVAVQPPPSLRWPDGPSLRAIAGALAVVVLALAVFIDAVHLGHRIVTPAIGAFASTFSAQELSIAAADRAQRWQERPIVQREGIAREDHYLTEAQWHVQRRNQHQRSGDLGRAFRENLILERYFAPALEATEPPYRWPADLRAEAASAAIGQPAEYVSDAAPYAIFTDGHDIFWGAVIGITILLAAVVYAAGRAATLPAAV